MFQSNTFVRKRHRGPEVVLFQFIMLGALLFVSMVAVIAFIHFSSGSSNASNTAPHHAVSADTVEVIVPIDNIEAGAALDPAMFRRDRRPSITIGPEMIRDFEEVKGLYSKGVLVSNQPILRDFLTSLQPVNALTASIPTGYRAVAIPVDATSSVEGWAQPGARVDVIWVTEFTGTKTACAIASNAKVLSANRRTEANNTDDPREKGKDEQIPSTVTLLLTAKDSLRVRLASLHGRLGLSLRGSLSGGAATVCIPITINDVVGDRPMPVRAPSENVRVLVKDRKNGKVEVMNFENWERVREFD